MRTFKLVLLSFPALTLFACFAFGQDPGMQAAQMAAQQSMQAAQQANDQAMRDMQQASQNAQQAMQSAQQASDTTWQCAGCFARMPAFSVKPGKYSAPITVKIRDATRGAVIYYTTDGWTPTENSIRYRGPITIATTTSLQAIAISRVGGRSRIATALYTLDGTRGITSISVSDCDGSSRDWQFAGLGRRKIPSATRYGRAIAICFGRHFQDRGRGGQNRVHAGRRSQGW